MFRLCRHCAHRCELPVLFEERGFRTGVEVGVLHGNYSRALLSHWSGKLHLIDPWANYPGYGEAELRHERFQDAGHNFSVTMQVLAEFSPERWKVWRCRNSTDTAKRIGFVDFAYVDGNHSYQWVAEDLRIWWSWLREGGILAGHDLFQIEEPDVTEAVVVFAREQNRDVWMVPGKDGCTCGEGGVPSWWIEK